MFDFSAEKTEFGMDNTLHLLGLDYVDLIQVSVNVDIFTSANKIVRRRSWA